MSRREPLISLLVTGTGDADSARIRALREGLAVNGVGWREAVRPLTVLGDERQAFNFVDWGRRFCRLPRLWTQLSLDLCRHEPSPWLLLPYPGHLDALALAPIARALGFRVALDLFTGLHETLVEDRQRLRRGSPGAALLRAIDQGAARAPDLLIADDARHLALWRARGLRPRRAVVVPPSAPACFSPGAKPRRAGGRLRVLHVGSHIPLHGGTTIVEAAKRLVSEPIDFVMLGEGQERAGLEASAPKNLTFFDAVPLDELPALLRDAELVLGTFGASAKAQCVVPQKVFQALACGRPLITARTPSQSALLRDRQDAWLVEPSNATELAAAISALAADSKLREQLGAQGRRRFEEVAAPGVATAALARALLT